VEILAVGNANIDITVFVECVPEPDEDVDVTSAVVGVGGSASNFAVACSRLGAKSAILAVVGDDPLGRYYLEEMAKRGVDTRLVRIGSGVTTGFVVIINELGKQRRMLRARGANLLLNGEVLQEASPDIKRAEVLHASSVRLRIARKLGEIRPGFSWDPGWRAVTESRQEVLELLNKVGRLFLNELEAMKLSGEENVVDAAMALSERGVPEVVVKRGSRGALVCLEGRVLEAPALRVKAVDTTGAGDVFDAAYTVARLRGMTPQQALRAANVAAGLAVTKAGATEGIPSWNELCDVLEQSK